ncbi:MAG: PAS domain-containing protein [Candidatus Hydrogenedentes bacterium]|nr:PAS domain-containing protein [Candidatus Hydrogenedentota bacterium]
MLDLYEQIVNSLGSGVIALDPKGRIIMANPAAAAYLDVDSSVLAPGTAITDVPNAGPLASVLLEVTQSGQPLSRHEITLALPNGTVKQIGLSASVHTEEEALNGIIVLFTDMTERVRLERSAELNRQLAALGELTAGVVHELRNPVSIISGMAELLIRKLEPEDERMNAAQTILRETADLERLISQFLGFARPFELQRGKCTADAIVDRTVQLCIRRAEQKGVTLEGQSPANIRIHADLYRVAQALSNIANNAIEAVPPGGRVSIRVAVEDSEVVFEIEDNGPGISLMPGEDVFRPFFTKKEGGTGLGLTIAHRIIAAHEGTVKFDSEAVGGACFQVRLPRANPDPPAT